MLESRESPRRIPSASLLENVVYTTAYALPAYLQGLFRRNRFWVGFWGAVHPDYAGVKFISRLRRKHKSSYFYIRLFTTRALVVLDPSGIERVLERSPLI